MAKKQNQSAPVAAPKDEGPMTMLDELKAKGMSEADAVKTVLEGEEPSDQVKAFAQLVHEAFTAKQVTGVAGKACEPYYRVQAVTPHGIFHSAGMKFTREPTKVYRKNLTEQQIKTLEHENPMFLAVVPVQFE